MRWQGDDYTPFLQAISCVFCKDISTGKDIEYKAKKPQSVVENDRIRFITPICPRG
ncbi:hypothetical protein SAMN06265364_11653 [Prevotella jejuni]|uniref:Uncharacterized protein n=1 Tax=Prevotella jejuni TaxID=1177574 RepID=A0AA94IUR9_9BACT|nr:hypothetical protein SAMN06265364_11653 [Prevotella jejuni]